MRAHYIQHVPFEGLGIIEPWLKKKGYQISSTRFFESADLPQIRDIDFLIILGGPMSINEEDTYPWLISEKKFIKESVEAEIPVLGICLGAQLIASAMGSNIYKNSEKEIGWFSVQGIHDNDPSAFRFPSSFECFHWHGETFDLPPNAIHLAENEICSNQAFQIGNTTIGLQFHLEMTLESVKKIIKNCRHELVPSIYIQTEQEMLTVPEEQFRNIHKKMVEVLNYLHNNIKPS